MSSSAWQPAYSCQYELQMACYPNPWCACSLRPPDQMNDLCHLFACAAWKTWWDLRDSVKFDIAVSEDSITDMLLLEMLRRTNQLVCKRFTRRQEAKSGADWLWWFISGNSGFPVVIQSKRLYASRLPGNRRYEALRYKPNRHDQTNTMLRNACKKDWFPMFCFYNFGPSPRMESPCWGCSLAAAESVKETLIRSGPSGNRLDSILPISVPWCHLVCHLAPSEGQFPVAIRRRVIEITGIGTAPRVQELPPYVHELLGIQSAARDSESPTQPLDDGGHLAGFVVVSDQPIRDVPDNRDNPR